MESYDKRWSREKQPGPNSKPNLVPVYFIIFGF